jgi:hypothetical protein
MIYPLSTTSYGGSNYKKNVSLQNFYWHNMKEIILMFKKLVSNIPFNPSLIEHIPNYKASLKKERSLRLVGLLLLLIAFAAQLFITIFPVRSSYAASPNNLLSGGFSSKSEVINDCDDNLESYQSILAYYSINCKMLASATNTTISASSYNNQLYSLNRIPYGQPLEQAITINQQSYWLRPLSEGSGLNSAKLKSLSLVNRAGTKYFILYNSGNLVLTSRPSAPTTCNPNTTTNCPKLYVTARYGQVSNANGTTAQPKDELIYTLEATNLSKTEINNFVIKANFSSVLSYADVYDLYGGNLQNNNVIWPATSILPSQAITKSATFIVASPVSNKALSSADSNYYNLKMTTLYGNAITIKLPWTFSKYIELKVNNAFPSEGVIASLIISVLLILYLLYFLYRNHLMLKELDNVRRDYLNGDRN